MTMQINGLPELIAKLGRLGAAQYLRPALKNAGMRVRDIVKKYPPNSDANMPGAYPKRWYRRGYGPRWARKRGGVGGRRTSEHLGKRWAVYPGAFRAVVSNDASYAVYVHGAERQAGFHARRGWITDETALRQATPQIEQEIQQAVNRELG